MEIRSRLPTPALLLHPGLRQNDADLRGDIALAHRRRHFLLCLQVTEGRRATIRRLEKRKEGRRGPGRRRLKMRRDGGNHQHTCEARPCVG